MVNSIELGSLVVAKAGRDCGEYFVVVELIGEDYILLINGKSRTKDKPKLKKNKHVKNTGVIVTEVIDRFNSMTDAEINRTVKECIRRL